MTSSIGSKWKSSEVASSPAHVRLDNPVLRTFRSRLATTTQWTR